MGERDLDLGHVCHTTALTRQAQRGTLGLVTIDLLPDCRTRAPVGVVRGRGDDGVERNFVRAYCGNCGKPDGYVTETAAHVFVLCNACVAKHGVPAGAMRAPTEVWQETIAEATRDMSEIAIRTALDDPNSSLSKLATDYHRVLKGQRA
jgi:hypothetical protein